ncbi:hypothetical protein SAMD00024442_41_27 [Candidatus Symbiothrix dinenymphae]|nr:hypothetical protein SAMD00024442_41_27 [Candidatus Symbiothrix dinenymphae]
MSITIYGPQGYKNFIHRAESRLKVGSNLNIQQVPNGIIAVDEEDIHSFGVFDSHGKFIKQSLMTHGNGQCLPKHWRGKKMQNFDIDVVYLGNLNESEFGHFMLEQLSRAFPMLLDKYKNTTALFIGKPPIPNFATQLIDLLNIEKMMVLDESAQFKNVFVPAQAFRLDRFSSQEMGNTYRCIADSVSEGYGFDKIYLSRAALTYRKTLGEEKIQNIFAKNGYHIVYPEKLLVKEQIAYVKNAKFLAGIGGTALHWALCMPSGGTVIQIKRNKLLKDNFENQYLINKTKGLNSVFISGSLEIQKTKHCTEPPQIIGVTPYMKQFFDENGFVYDSSDLEFDAEAWNDYRRTLDAYIQQNGSLRYAKIKSLFIKIVACIIPYRQPRRHFRAWLQKVL